MCLCVRWRGAVFDHVRPSSTSVRCLRIVEEVKHIDWRQSSSLMVSEGVGSRGWCGCARRGIDERNGAVCFSRILDMGVVRREGLRIIVVIVVAFLLLLALGLLFLVQLALVLLIFRYAGLRGVGQLSLCRTNANFPGQRMCRQRRQRRKIVQILQ